MLSPDVYKRYRIEDGGKFRLADFDPGDTDGLDLGKSDAKPMLAEGAARLAQLQERLYAEHQWALVIILQGMDTAGKDGVVEHVMSGVNPLGCAAYSFKAPSEDELAHDFLWRAQVAMPRRGHIGIFNRSYYEEVLVVRLHPEILAKQRIPAKLVGDEFWKHRFNDIVAYEEYLARNGIIPLKFFLHMSKEQQRKRLLERTEDPDKHWKFQLGDLAERRLWDRYMEAYEDMIRRTATAQAPWHVVPADNKWFTRLVVAATVVDVLEKLDPKLPRLDTAALAEMEKARQELLSEAG